MPTDNSSTSCTFETSRSPATRCAVLGLGTNGAYIAESLSLNGFELVAITATHGEEARLVDLQRHPLLGQKVIGRDELLKRRDLDWLVVTSPLATRAADTRAAIDAGFNVLIEAPLAASFGETKTLLELAKKANRACLAWVGPRDDSDFRQAWSVRQSGQLGRLRSAVFTLRQAAASGLPATCSAADSANSATVDLLTTFGWRYFDQLLRLIDQPIVRVFGVVNCGQLCFDSLASCGAQSEQECGFLAVIEFADGCVAQIEIDLASSTTVSPQWLLQGDRGGYVKGKQSCLERDGEIYEVDIATESREPFEELRAPTESVALEVQHLVRVAGLIEAVRESSRFRDVKRFEI